MKTEDLIKLAVARRKIDTKVKAVEASTKAKTGPYKAKLNQIDEKLIKYVNKTGKEGTLQSFKLPDDSTVYASESDKYSTKDRTELDAWVLEPLHQTIAGLEQDLAEEEDADLQEVLGDELNAALQMLHKIHNRMGIFSNTIVKDSAIAFRKDTGATDIEGSLKGGKLPGGVRMFKQPILNFRKG